MEDNSAPSQASAQEKCSKCQGPININYFFCPNCGNKLKEPPFRLSWTSIAGYLLLSLLFPPLGIFPGIKHLRIPDQKAKILGILYITLTIIATVLVIKITLDYINNLNEMLSDVNNLQSYY